MIIVIAVLGLGADMTFLVTVQWCSRRVEYLYRETGSIWARSGPTIDLCSEWDLCFDVDIPKKVSAGVYISLLLEWLVSFFGIQNASIPQRWTLVS